MQNSHGGTSPSPSSGGGQNKVYITANPKSYRAIKWSRDELKKNPTEAEAILWKFLKNRATGYKIRRQHIIQSFIVDFVCLKKQLVIEVDGKIHDKQKDYDEFRTDYLNQLGYTVIRFTNEEVFKDPEAVVNQIKSILNNHP